MFYYVIQVIGGHFYAHGPYKSEPARDNRLENVTGGEITAFNSFSEDPVEAIKEFKGSGR